MSPPNVVGRPAPSRRSDDDDDKVEEEKLAAAAAAAADAVARGLPAASRVAADRGTPTTLHVESARRSDRREDAFIIVRCAVGAFRCAVCAAAAIDCVPLLLIEALLCWSCCRR